MAELISNKAVVREVAEATGQTMYTVGKVIDALGDLLATHLEQGDKVRIKGVGQFETVDRKEREVWVPSKGEKTTIPAIRKTRVTPAHDIRAFDTLPGTGSIQ